MFPAIKTSHSFISILMSCTPSEKLCLSKGRRTTMTEFRGANSPNVRLSKLLLSLVTKSPEKIIGTWNIYLIIRTIVTSYPYVTNCRYGQKQYRLETCPCCRRRRRKKERKKERGRERRLSLNNTARKRRRKEGRKGRSPSKSNPNSRQAFERSVNIGHIRPDLELVGK